MQFDRPITETIRARHSIRTYGAEPIGEARSRALEDACRSLTRAPFGEPARFLLVERPPVKGRGAKVSGFSLQRDARHFLVGAVAASDTALEGYGYLMEQLVLRATELGLGTCWMGYFDREAFADFETSADELFPAIAAVGVPAAKARAQDELVRGAVKADARKGWDELFFLGSFGRPLSKDGAGLYAEPLEMLRWAPSSGNTQPWRVVKAAGEDTFHLYLKKVRMTYFMAGMHDLDIGIAMSHLELTARERGLEGRWAVADPGLPSVPPGTEYRVSWSAT